MNEFYDLKADIWSLGTIVYEMLVGFAPFTGFSVPNLADNLKKGNYAIPKNLKLSLSCLDFIDKCLKRDPEKRITYEELENHPFIRLPIESGTINLMAS